MTPEQINDLLNDMKLELGFKTDVQLADYLKVNPLTIWRWRQGQLPTITKKLLAFLWHRSTADLTTA
jgi:hypothetical protein